MTIKIKKKIILLFAGIVQKTGMVIFKISLKFDIIA